MDFRIKREPFLKELALLQDVATQKKDRPILAGVRLEVKDGELLLDATDTEVSLGCICTDEHDGLVVAQSGAVVVDAKRLHSYIKGMESEEVKCSTDEQGWLSIWYPNRLEGNPLYRMPGFPVDDFPAIPEQGDGDDWKSSSLPAPAFASLASRVESIVLNTQTQSVPPGALLEFGEDAVRMIATDGVQLRVAARDIKTEKPWNVVIPKRALIAIASMCKAISIGGAVEISRGPNQIFAAADGRLVSATLLTGQYPSWRPIFKKLRSVKLAVLDTKKFRAAAARAAAVLDVKGLSGIKLGFSASGLLRFDAKDSLFGEASEEMEITYKIDEKAAENMADKNLTIRINHNYLLDFLGGAQSDIMRVAGFDGEQPLKLVDGDLATDGFQVECVLMAINENVAQQVAEVKVATASAKADSAVAGASEKPRKARGKRKE